MGGFHVRPFSTFTSPQEYGVFLLLGTVLLWVRVLHNHGPRVRQLALFGITVVALFLQSSRGIFLGMLLAVLIITVLDKRSLSGVMFALAVLALWLSPLAPRATTHATVTAPAPTADGTVQPTPASGTSGTSSALFNHELEGLLHPSESTAPLHVEIVKVAVQEGIRNPLGLGPSTYGVVAGRAANAAQTAAGEVNPENQLPLTMAALGIPAAIVLLALYLSNFVFALALWRRQPSTRHLVWIGFLIAGADQLLNGRLYATSTILALVVGGISTEYGRLRASRRTRLTPSANALAGGGQDLSPAPSGATR